MTFALEGDKLMIDKSVYTVLKLTDDDLEVRGAPGVAYTFKKLKP